MVIRHDRKPWIVVGSAITAVILIIAAIVALIGAQPFNALGYIVLAGIIVTTFVIRLSPIQK